MKTKLFRFSLALPIIALIMSGCGKDLDNVTGYMITDADGEALLAESRNIFDEQIKTVCEPDFATLYGNSETVAETQNGLTPVWDDAAFSNEGSHSTLKVPLEGSTLHYANIYLQMKADEKYEMRSSRKVMDNYLVFTKDNASGEVEYTVATTIADQYPGGRGSRIADCIIYSDKLGVCGELAAVTDKGEESLALDANTAVLDQNTKPEYAYIKLDADVESSTMFYIANGEVLKKDIPAQTPANVSKTLASPLDSMVTCNICHLPYDPRTQSSACPHMQKTGEYEWITCSICNNTYYTELNSECPWGCANYGDVHCSICLTYLGTNPKAECNTCGYNPNRRNVRCTNGLMCICRGGSGQGEGAEPPTPPTYESLMLKYANMECPLPLPVNPEIAAILYPVPESRQFFAECVNGVIVIWECPPGLHYNPYLQICDWPDAVEEWYNPQP